MVREGERGLNLQLPIDISSRLSQKVQEVLEEEGQQAIVIKDLLGRSAIVTVIEPKTNGKNPKNKDPFPPAA